VAPGSLAAGDVHASGQVSLDDWPNLVLGWNSVQPSRDWRSISASSSGTHFLAAAAGGGIFSSPDSGQTWTNEFASGNWQTVVVSGDGALWAAADYGNQIQISRDFGVSWTASGPAANWLALASSDDGQHLLAAGDDSQLYVSSDSGASWSERESSRTWVSVASSADGAILAAADFGGHVYVSTNYGQDWTVTEQTRNWESVDLSGDGSKIYAVARGAQIYTSTDFGQTWTPREAVRHWISISSSDDGENVLAATLGGRLYVSNDAGQTWVAHQSNRNWKSVTSDGDGRQLIGAVAGGKIWISKNLPFIETPGSTFALQVSVGTGFSCALTIEGSVQCVGLNDIGQLGDSTLTNRASPVPVSSLSDVVKVETGSEHACALLSSGRVSCWGRNTSGQLGNNATVQSSVPVSVLGIGGDNVPALDISLGRSHSCALLADGRVACWGEGSSYQFGNNATTDKRIPFVISGVSNVTALDAGGDRTCAIIDQANVKCWGAWRAGIYGMTYNKNAEVIASLNSSKLISVGSNHICGVLSDGSVRCETAYESGSGSGVISGISSPIEISAGTSSVCALSSIGEVYCWTLTAAALVPGLTGAQHISVGGGSPSTVLALTDAYSVVGLGQNDYGEAGNPNVGVDLATFTEAEGFGLDLTLTPTPAVTGVAEYGETLTVDPGTWDDGVTLSYQWLRSGTPINDATEVAYFAQLADVGSAVSVRSVGRKWGYRSVQKQSYPTETVSGGYIPSDTPEIIGPFRVGSTLTVDLGDWLEGVAFTYRWYNGATLLAGEDGDSIVVDSSLINEFVSVEVTGSRSYFIDTSARSAASPQISPGLFETDSSRMISGSAVVGQTLTANLGVWDPAPTTVAYQWLLNGAVIRGATGSTYVVGSKDVGRQVSVRVTGSRASYVSTVRESTRTSAVLAGFPFDDSPVPTISGSAVVGQTLSASVTGWDPAPTTVAYQWLAGGQPIKGATLRTYVVGAKDVGRQVSVRVTGSRASYVSTVRESTRTSAVTR
jgi:hypothetical protein